MPSINSRSPILKFQRQNSTFGLKNGFTLIELLIVITIIGILVASGIYSWQSAQLKGRDNRRKSDIKAVQQALESYYQVNGIYPSTSSGVITCNISGSSTTNAWGEIFTCGGNTYFQRLPTDPNQQSTLSYYYDSPSPNMTYILSANLENENDPDLNTVSCTPQGTRNYCVENP